MTALGLITVYVVTEVGLWADAHYRPKLWPQYYEGTEQYEGACYMGRSRLVKPDAVKLDISDGDWIVVKKQLTAGETHRIFSDLVKTANAGEKFELEPRLVGFTKVGVYLVDWSQEELPIRGCEADEIIKALQQIDQESFKEISDAVDAHEKRMEEDRKNARTAPPLSEPISPSPV